MSTPATTFTGAFFAGSALTVKASPTVNGKSGSFVYQGRSESYNTFTVDVKTTGSPASYSVQLEGSLDNRTWYIIGTAITADGVYNRTVAGAGVNFPFIRANITAVSGGTSPTITMNWVAIS